MQLLLEVRNNGMEDWVPAFIAIIVVIAAIGIIYSIVRAARGEVYVAGAWGNGLWVPRKALKRHILGEQLPPKILKRARKKLPKRAKYLCFVCEGKIEAGSSFCPNCGEEQKDVPPIDFTPKRKKKGLRTLGAQEAQNGGVVPTIVPPKGRRKR